MYVYVCTDVCVCVCVCVPVGLWVREALLAHVVTEHLYVAAQHVTQSDDFVLLLPNC